MAGKAVAVDPGGHTIKVMALKDGKDGLQVSAFASFPAGQKSEGLLGTGISLSGVVAGVAGRDMTLRYTQVPPAPDWQLRNLMELEISELSSQSGDELSADYNLLPPTDEEAGSDTILMALARNEALQRVSDMLSEAKGSVSAHVPNCIAIYNAYLRTFTTDEDQVVCIASIGHETIDIALAKGQDLLFARNLSGGGKVLDDAIAAAFNVSGRKAENLKKELLDLDPASRGKFASGQAEKVTMAAGGSSSMIVSAIQSSLAFCKTQTKQPDLNLDLVLLCGGSAKLRGIRGLLREALRCPINLFDPFASVDLSTLTAPEIEELDANRSEAVVSLGLAVTVMDNSLYSLEILPAAVKRRQRFVRRTVFNIGAAAIMIAVLVFTAMTLSKNAVALKAQGKKYQRTLSKIKSIDSQTETVVKTVELQRKLLDELVKRSVPFDGIVRVMRALQDLPADMWIETIEVDSRSGRGRNQKYGVKVKGHGKEGSVAIAAVYAAFVAKLKKRKGIGKVTTPGFTPKGNTIDFEWFFDQMPPAEAAKTHDEGEGK